MTPRELDRAVARATGESVSEIRRRGFSLADQIEDEFDAALIPPCRTIDWDDHDLRRNVSFVPQPISSLRFSV